METSLQKSSLVFVKVYILETELTHFFSGSPDWTFPCLYQNDCVCVFKGGERAGSSFMHVWVLLRTHTLHAGALFASGKN